jgi:2-dehydro-3-deoxyglucarate aldolase/4-hydroxy-2-oxoheptanedioate aldolase
MPTNSVKQQLAEGKVPVGHMIWEFKTRGVATLIAGAGCDFVLLDMEHSSFSSDSVADLLAWMRGVNLPAFVRVPDLEYHFVARCLDAGALGIMVPDVKSVDMARKAVDFVRYPPAGHRGLGLGHAHTGYTPPSNPGAFLEEANRAMFVICQMESQPGIDSADAIAAIDGVDCLWVGHNDLTANLGIPGQFDNPIYTKAIDAVVAACRKHGKAAGFQPGNAQQARWALSQGFNIISWNADSSLYKRALTDGVNEVRKLVQEGVLKR